MNHRASQTKVPEEVRKTKGLITKFKELLIQSIEQWIAWYADILIMESKCSKSYGKLANISQLKMKIYIAGYY